MNKTLRELAKGIISDDDLDKIEKFVKSKNGDTLTVKDIEKMYPFYLYSRMRWAFRWDAEKAEKMTVLILVILFNNDNKGMRDEQLAWLNSHRDTVKEICEEMKDKIPLNPEYFDEDFNCIYDRKLIQNILKRMAKTAEDINRRNRANFVTAIAVPNNIGEKETSLKLEIYLKNINGKEIKDYPKRSIVNELTSHNNFFKVTVYDENCLEDNSDGDILNKKFIYKKKNAPRLDETLYSLSLQPFSGIKLFNLCRNADELYTRNDDEEEINAYNITVRMLLTASPQTIIKKSYMIGEKCIYNAAETLLELGYELTPEWREFYDANKERFARKKEEIKHSNFKRQMSSKGFMYAFIMDKKKHESVCIKAKNESVSTEGKNPDKWYVTLHDFEYNGETVDSIIIRKKDIGTEFSFRSFSVRFYNTKEGILSAFKQSLDVI